MEDDAQILAWPGRGGRLYTIITADHMGDEMTNRMDYTEQPGIDGTMSFTNAWPSKANFFSIRVRQEP